MRHTKTLLAALTAILALAATLGTASAFASGQTVLCRVNQNPCQAANIAPAGTWLAGAAQPSELSDTSFAIKAGSGVTYTCNFFIGGETLQSLGTSISLPARPEAYLNPSSCKALSTSTGKEISSCAEGSVTGPTKALILRGKEGAGALTMEGGISFTIDCLFKEPCKWGTGALGMSYALSGLEWYLSQKVAKMTLESGSKELCGETAELNLKMETALFGSEGVYITAN